MNEVPLLLYKDNGKCQNVAVYHTTYNNKEAEIEEDVSHTCIACTKRFQNPYEVGSLKYNNEQTAYHSHTSHTYHKDKNNPHI